MNKKRALFIFFILIQTGMAQTNSWKGYFSYNAIKGITDSDTAVFAATENALFSKNNATNIIKTINTIDGLPSQDIASIYYSPVFKKTLVGYASGLLAVINEADGKVTKITDIINKDLPQDIKKVNHFEEYNGLVYLSCDFGIVQFNLQTLLFGDTYFIGENGAETSVRQIAISNGFIFAATATGIRRALLANKNLIDYAQWQKIDDTACNTIAALSNLVYASTAAGLIKKYDSASGTFANARTLPEPVKELRTKDPFFLVTTASTVYFYDSNLTEVKRITRADFDSKPSFVCATLLAGKAYLGTAAQGLLVVPMDAGAPPEAIMPSGPEINNIFRLKKTNATLWATYGRYEANYSAPSLNLGVSRFSSELGWNYIPFDQINANALTDIAVNPKNENEVFICSFSNGLIRINNGGITLFNDTTAPPNGPENQQFYGPGFRYIGINGAAFDSKGNLWMTNIWAKNGLKIYKPNNTWESVTDWNTEVVNITDERYGKMIVDKNDTKWIPSALENGLIAYNERFPNKYRKIKTGDEGNLPSMDVRAVAVDRKNELWIGTRKGLRVISNIDAIQSSSQVQSKSIIITEKGLAQELFYDQFILDIAVDGADKKWVSVADGGIFLVSSNGQQTFYHFTKDNSPLPSNNVNDIEIDGVTGEVFFATDKGLVSFKGIATAPSANLNNVFAYPNPVRPEYDGTVKISGLIDKANIKITDISGNLVFETVSVGGTIEWDTTAFGSYKVASGVYMIFITAQDGSETKVKKLMIIR